MATEGLRDEGKIEQGSQEWSDALREYYGKKEQEKFKRSRIESELAQNGLSSDQKKHLAREFFNYWDCREWTENGKQIRLASQVNKWTQREITRKHKGSGHRGSGSETTADAMRRIFRSSTPQAPPPSKLQLEVEQKRDEHKREAECQYANQPHYR